MRRLRTAIRRLIDALTPHGCTSLGDTDYGQAGADRRQVIAASRPTASQIAAGEPLNIHEHSNMPGGQQ